MRSVDLIAGCCVLLASVAQGQGEAGLSTEIGRIERLLDAWQFPQARQRADALLAANPDSAPVQYLAAWVKFHGGEHQTALQLMERAISGLGASFPHSERFALVKATARIAQDFQKEVSQDGKVVVFRRPGADEILSPYILEAIARTLKVVGEDLGYQVDHPVLVEIVPDGEALAAMTGLTADEIRTSGTIAVCKYGRLMVTSPRATLKGFGWLDTASHELIHLIIAQKTWDTTPIWIHEALAKYEDSRWRVGEPLYRPGLSPIRESHLAAAIADNALIPFEKMHPSMAKLPSQEAAELAFSEVYMVTSFLLERKGYAGIRELLVRLKQGNSDLQAIEAIYGLDRTRFVRAWMDYMKRLKLKRLVGKATLDEPGGPEKNRRSGAERSLARQERTELRDYFHLGELLRARGRTRAAVVEYGKAVRRAGADHAALWLLSSKWGLSLTSLGRNEEAKKAFEASLSNNPWDLEAYLHLGRMLIGEDPFRAWLLIREALRINPLDPRVHQLAKEAAAALSKKSDTRENWAQQEARHQKALQILYRGPAPAEKPESAAP